MLLGVRKHMKPILIRYARENPLGISAVALASAALICLRLPSNLAMEVALGSIILIATLTSLVLSVVSIVREPSKVLGIIGLLAIVLGETYRLPLVLINAFTLLVLYYPIVIGALLVALLLGYMSHSRKARTKQ
jgi:hypothetical protein